MHAGAVGLVLLVFAECELESNLFEHKWWREMKGEGLKGGTRFGLRGFNFFSFFGCIL